MYDGRSRNLGVKRSDKTVLRLATPVNGEIIINDIISETSSPRCASLNVITDQGWDAKELLEC